MSQKDRNGWETDRYWETDDRYDWHYIYITLGGRRERGGAQDGVFCLLAWLLSESDQISPLSVSTANLLLLYNNLKVFRPVPHPRDSFFYTGAYPVLKSTTKMLSKVNMKQQTEVQSQVESYQRFKIWYLITPCLTLSITRHGSRVYVNIYSVPAVLTFNSLVKLIECSLLQMAILASRNTFIEKRLGQWDSFHRRECRRSEVIVSNSAWSGETK